MKTAVAGVLLLVSIVYVGCSSLTDLIKEPKVSLANLNIKDPTFEGATIVFGLLVENPNSVSLSIDNLVYDLELSGKALSSGELNEGASVPAKSSAVINVPIAFKYTDLFNSIAQLLKDQKSPYRLKGAAKIGPFKIPFDQSGELVLPKKKLF